MRSEIPPMSLANDNYHGVVPDCLKDLTMVEEAMIARSRCKSWIVQLKEGPESVSNSTAQRGLKGHVIVYPQNITDYSSVMPVSLNDIAAPICVIFIGSQKPSREWLRHKARPLIVRREKIRDALHWLKSNNRLYSDVVIDQERLDAFPEEDVIPVHVEVVENTDTIESLTSDYTTNNDIPSTTKNDVPSTTVDGFEKIVVSNIDNVASSNEMRAAAFRHFREDGKQHAQIPHGDKPVNEFFDPHLFPRLYPTLFPYGIGGVEDRGRAEDLSFKRSVKHLFSLRDRRFQEHYSFMFTVFNIMQRRDVLLHTAIKVDKPNFARAAENYSSVSPETIAIVTERLAKGDYKTFNSPDEKRVLDLMKDVNVISAHVAGSSASKVQRRNEIRALTYRYGLPSFYLTINPADVYNPLVNFLAGQDIDIDALLPECVHNYHEQASLLARNPSVAAKFFNKVIEAFIECILGCNKDKAIKSEGVLGCVNAYYGCVEAQGRGTLHCHLVIWLDGAKNVDEIRERVLKGDVDFQRRLIEYLDDTIINDIIYKESGEVVQGAPDQSSWNVLNKHPCTTRGILPEWDGDRLIENSCSQADMRKLVEQCQTHKHSSTCYKYWKGPPDPKTCRFDLDEKNTQPCTYFDQQTGDLHMRCTNGMINNFNPTIIRNVRCNMDIKFIGSGLSAKAVMFYVTDYITKSQLKAHVAFAALECAARKLDEQIAPTNGVDSETRAKKLLQKCAFSMISRQELSAPQVMSYLLGHGDYYTGHTFRKFTWSTFERFVNESCPLKQNDNADPINGSESDQEDIPNHLNAESGNDETTVQGLTEEDIDGEIDERIAHPDTGEVLVTAHQGQLIAHSSCVADYQLRGKKLKNVCLWDYLSSVEKTSVASRDNQNGNRCIDEEEEEDETADLLSPTTWKRARAGFDIEHPESATHVQKVIHPIRRHVPVPLGPSIPRRDRQKELEKHQRLMLIFFKPWKQPRELLGAHDSWQNAFNEFMSSCSNVHQNIMNNMQLMHECKDSHDEHFAQRLQDRKSFKRAQCTGSGNFVDNLTNENICDEILQHVQDVEDCSSKQTIKSQCSASECHNAAAKGGVFTRPLSSDVPTNERVQTNDPNCSRTEENWRSFYTEQNDAAKQASQLTDESLQSANGGPSNSCMMNIGTSAHVDCSITGLASASLATPSASLERGRSLSANIAKKYTLNREQRRAYDIITNHRQSSKGKQLRMYIGGPGGTGKSRVIKALQEFFEQRGESRMLRLSSYTGIAAHNIGGMTLHSALSIGRKNRSAASNNKLVSAWQGVEYLFIDEVSMIGCTFLAKIDEYLRRAKENDMLFGGVNVIFAGDFAQLPPVGDTNLYATIGKSRGKINKTQREVFGKLLWMSVDTVVMLTEMMRQSGPENIEFQNLLTRLRTGRCTQADFNLLNTRLLQNNVVDWASGEWDDAPMVVADNETKDTLNVEASAAYARSRNEPLHFYYGIHTRHGERLNDTGLNDFLNNLSTGKTNQTMGALPLVSGMPVMLCQNYDVPSGIVNGCVGILKQINYVLDDCGNRYATSAVISSDTVKYRGVHGLRDHEFMVFPEDNAITFRHPYSKANCTIHRKQLPIVPAYAVTSHKSQGQTYPKCLVDLNDCKGSESPYVMLSRATSLQNVIILRPFNIGKIQCRQSEDSRTEFRRLGLLRLQTTIQYGSPSEVVQATRLLGTREGDRWCNVDPGLKEVDSLARQMSAISTKIANEELEDFSEFAFTGKRNSDCLDED